MCYSPYRDQQDVAPLAYCKHCGAELYEYDNWEQDICPNCEKEKETEHEVTED